MFTIQEGYNIHANNINNNERSIWKKIWAINHWPKVEYFLWLLSYRKILTWDQLQKRGMHGPSICYMCRKTNESIEHLLNSCEIAETMWNGIARTFMKTYRDNTNINATIIKWRKGGFKSEVLNRASRLSIGFILWGIWKERNHRIFRGEFNNNNEI